eukprot:2692694-Lingulodinium_polyedra.AAC.1
MSARGSQTPEREACRLHGNHDEATRCGTAREEEIVEKLRGLCEEAVDGWHKLVVLLRREVGTIES